MKTSRGINSMLKAAPIMLVAPLVGLLFVIALPYLVVAMFTAMAGAKLVGHALPGTPGRLIVRHS